MNSSREPDSIERLARDLSRAHPRLDDIIVTDISVWRRVIAGAIGGSPAYRELLRAGVRADLSQRAYALICGTDSGAGQCETSATAGASAAVTDCSDAHHTRPALECWCPEEFTDRDAVSHACTVLPPAADCAVAS